MASTYPSVVATLTNPSPTQTLSSPSHSSIHTNENTEILQLQTFVGTLSSVSGTLMYDVRAAASGGGGHVQTAALGGTGQTSWTKGDLLLGLNSSTLTKLAVGADNQVLTANSSVAAGVNWTSGGKFGGTGADGALSISSGTTTINLGSSVLLVKNYSSISITGTGALGFTNPNTNGTTIILKSQGNVTLTSSAAPMINASALGGAGGASVSGGTNYSGNVGNDGYGVTFLKSFAGRAGTNSASGDNGSIAAIKTDVTTPVQQMGKYPFVIPGAGGGSGGSTSGTGSYASGAGGNGGGALIIECGGAFNFTTTNGISVAGGNGSNASVLTSGNTGAGGGGGGGGGVFVALYNSLTSSVGTVSSAAGTTGTNAGGGGTAGGGGGSYKAAGAGVGFGFMAQNTEFQ